MRTLSIFAAILLCIWSDTSALTAQAVSGRAGELRVGGRAHTQFRTSSAEGGDSEFLVRRARLTVDGSVNDFISGRVQAEFGGGDAELKDAYLRLSFAPEFRVSMGQFKRAFDLFELSSSTDLSIIERDGRIPGFDDCAGVGGTCSYSRLTSKLSLADRDIGVRFDGSSGRVSWLATVTNGAGANQSDDNSGKSFSSRVTIEVVEGLRLGAQLGVHDFIAPDDETEYATAWSGDVEYGSWRSGLHIQAALVRGENWKAIEEVGEDPTFQAFQGVVSYFAPVERERLVGVEPLLRVSIADPDTDISDDGGTLITPGLMFYVSGKNKLGVNVDIYNPQFGSTEHSFKLQSFLYF